MPVIIYITKIVKCWKFWHCDIFRINNDDNTALDYIVMEISQFIYLVQQQHALGYIVVKIPSVDFSAWYSLEYVCINT